MYKFIFVDDEEMAQHFFKDIINYNSYGFTLEKMFSSAELALEYVKKHRDISVVITDIKMGNMSGLDFCEKIREFDSGILLICLTGYKEFEYARRAIKVNVFDYLLKPTMYKDLETLFIRMKAYLDFVAKTRVQKNENTDALQEDEAYGKSIIDMAKDFIGENYNKNITLESVAQHVSMNPAYFSRFFKQHTNGNFIDYLSQIRIKKAIALLQDPRVRIGEICTMVGYKSPQHFYKLFKYYTGYTPTEFRAKNPGK